MKREHYDFIKDIHDSILDIADFTANLTYEEFIGDKKTVNAVIRSLEIIGEASKKIPPTIREKNTDIPWRLMAKMRDKLIHHYHGVDLDIIWVVVTEDLHPLEEAIKKLLAEL